MYPFEKKLNGGLDNDIEMVNGHAFFQLVDVPEEEDGRDGEVFAILDTETTGLDPKKDKLTEICVSLFKHADSTISKIRGGYHGLQDPGIHLSENIKKITGLTDEELAGKSIDKEELKAVLSKAHFVVAHNATFDKSFLDAFMGEELPLRWACSSSDIPWDEFGISGRKLEFLCLIHGFFYHAHRAQIDVDALGMLIASSPLHETPYIAYLRDAAYDSRHTIHVFARFEDKDTLKSNGFYWNPDYRTWDRSVTGVNLQDSLEWIEQTVPGCRVKVIEKVAKFGQVQPAPQLMDHDELAENGHGAGVDWS